MKPGTPHRHGPLLLAIGLIATAAFGSGAVILNVQPVTFAAGSTGDTLDVTLTNTGPSAVIIGGFSFGLNVGTSNLSFTGVSFGTTTATYVFAGQSLFGPDISVQPPNLPGQTLEAEDLFAIPGSGSSVGSGGTVGLGHLTFNLGAAASGGIPLSFVTLDDSLSDANGSPVAFSVVNGTVTVGAAVPEPATSGVVCTALIGLLGAFHRFRRRAN